jgi:hypothetical protein
MVLDSMVQTRSSLRATVTTGCLEQGVLKLFGLAIARSCVVHHRYHGTRCERVTYDDSITINKS